MLCLCSFVTRMAGEEGGANGPTVFASKLRPVGPTTATTAATSKQNTQLIMTHTGQASDARLVAKACILVEINASSFAPLRRCFRRSETARPTQSTAEERTKQPASKQTPGQASPTDSSTHDSAFAVALSTRSQQPLFPADSHEPLSSVLHVFSSRSVMQHC